MARAYEIKTTPKKDSGRAYELGGTPKKLPLIKPQISIPKKPVGFLETLKYLPSATWEQFTGGAKFPEKMKTSEKMKFFAKELPSASKEVAISYAKLIPRAFMRVASDVADPFIHWAYGVETPDEPTPSYPLIGEVPTTRKLYSQYKESGYSPLVSGLLAGSDVAMNFAIVLGIGEFFAKKVPVKLKTSEVKVSLEKTATGYNKVANLTTVNKSNTPIVNSAKYYKVGSKSLVEVVSTKEGTLQMTGFDISRTQFQNIIKKITNVGATKTIKNPEVSSLIIPDKAINTAIKSLVSKKVSPVVPIAVKGAIPVPTPGVAPAITPIPQEVVSKQVKPEKGIIAPEIKPEPIKVITRTKPSSITGSGYRRMVVEGHPGIYTDSFLLLEDRTSKEVSSWQEKQEPMEDKLKYDVIKTLYPKEKTNPTKFISFEKPKYGVTIAHIDVGKDKSIQINAEYYQWLNKEGYIIKSSGKYDMPLVLERNGKDVGLLMPIKGEGKTMKELGVISKPVKEVKSNQNIEYNQVIDKVKTQGAETLNTNELDTIAKGEQTIVTPIGKKPITPEDEATNKIIDLYAGFPLSKLADIPVTFNGTRMKLINMLGKEVIRYHGLTPDIKKLLVKLETIPDLTKDALSEFFITQFPVSANDAKLLSRHHENPGENPITPELEPYAESIKSLIDISKTMQISRDLMKEFFPQSFLNRANKEILQHQESIASMQKMKAVVIPERPALEKAHAVKKENTITKHQVAIDELNEYKEFLNGLQYLPHLYLQSEAIQNNILKLMPEGRITAAFRSALSKLKGRKIATMEDAKAMGLLPEEDIRIILASHFDYLYRKSLIYDVIQELKNNPQAILPEKEAPDYWDRVAVAQLNDFRVHPLLSAAITDFAVPDNTGTFGKIYDNVNWLGKAIVFFNPIILPFWDIFQGYAAGSINPIRTIASATIGGVVGGPIGAFTGAVISTFTQSNTLQAWRDVTGKTKVYEQLVERGVFRTPRVGYFSQPIENTMRVLVDRMDSQYPKWKKAVEKIIGKPIDWKTYTLFPDIYQTNWRLTWFLDRVLRTATYRHALNKGMDMDTAAEYTNNFHANYNLFTNRAKRTLNRAFFVPTYKANMIVNMPAYVAKNTFELAKSIGKGGPTPVQKASLGALMRVMVLVAGVLAFAAYHGYRLREGYRLVKKLDKPEITKEGKIVTERVITLPGPFAEIPKFVSRLSQGPKGLYMYMAKVPQISWGLSRNARWNGEPYWTEGAAPEYQRKEIMINMLKDYIAPIDRYSMMTDEETDAIDNILSTFGLATYKRGSTESRILWQITNEKSKLTKFLKRPDISIEDKRNAQRAYQEKVLKFIDELKDYQETFK